MYGNSHSEKLIGRVIAGQRDGVAARSTKVWPTHVTGNGIARACEASLARLGTKPQWEFPGSAGRQQKFVYPAVNTAAGSTKFKS